MARPYFRQVPNFEYINRNAEEQNISDYITVKNLFKRGKLREDIFGNLNFFTKYNIVGDERPDNVAFKLYGDSSLDWVVLLSNNILNIQDEWPMTRATFDQVMLEKYGTYETLYSGIHHYETNEIRDSIGRIVLRSGLRLPPTWKTNGNFLEIAGSQISSIYSGDGTTPSTVVTVVMENSIPDLEVGDQININNVVESQYNGDQIVSNIISQVGSNVTSFSYELPFTPLIASPLLSSPRKEEVLFVIPETSFITANSYYYAFWDEGLGYSVYSPSSVFLREVTNFEYELNIEEGERSIFTLKPRYLNVVFNDLDGFMPYKKGGDQFVNTTLKRGDNIRLFE